MNENSIGNWKTIVDKPANGDSLGRIDQYELIRELGGGGFGTVFLAKDTESEVDVAVKGLPPFVKNISPQRLCSIQRRAYRISLKM